MINIEYVGQKPIITETGISFKPKRDKFEYIEPTTHLLDMFLKLENGQTSTQRLNTSTSYDNHEILTILQKAVPNYNTIIEKKLEDYKKSLDEEVIHIKDREHLNEVEQDTLRKNLEFMRNYRIQRATNKLVYEEMINACVRIVKEKQIEDIKVPFTMQFVHIIESIQTTLQRERFVPDTDLHIYMHHEEPFAELRIAY